jgi:hypothetical protein
MAEIILVICYLLGFWDVTFLSLYWRLANDLTIFVSLAVTHSSCLKAFSDLLNVYKGCRCISDRAELLQTYLTFISVFRNHEVTGCSASPETSYDCFKWRYLNHVPNTVIRKDLQIPTVKEEIQRYSSQYSARLSARPNDLILNLMELPDNRRRQRHLPNDLSTRFLVWLLYL